MTFADDVDEVLTELRALQHLGPEERRFRSVALQARLDQMDAESRENYEASKRKLESLLAHRRSLVLCMIGLVLTLIVGLTGIIAGLVMGCKDLSQPFIGPWLFSLGGGLVVLCAGAHFLGRRVDRLVAMKNGGNV